MSRTDIEVRRDDADVVATRAERERHPRDADFIADEWPRAPRRGPRARAPRRPSLKRLLASAEKAGVPVRSATVGGVTLHFGEPETKEQPGNELDEWLKKHAH